METNEKKVKDLDLTKPYFKANGKKYFIETKLNISRFVEYQILEQEVAYSLSFKKIFNEIKECYEKLYKANTNGETHEVLVKLDNLMRGVANLEQKEPAILKLCTLFINTENEDRTNWNDDLATQKIEDWKAENYAIDGFFRLALNFIDGFLTTYKKVNQTILETEQPKGSLTQKGVESNQ